MMSKVEFKPVTDQPPHHEAEPTAAPVAVPWITPVGDFEAQERLFHFLRALRAGRFQVSGPLLVERATLHAICARPQPDLAEALRHCLDHALIDFGPDGAQWGELAAPPWVWSLVLAAYNCLTPPIAADGTRDEVDEFGAALLAALPPARALPDMLIYQAILQLMGEALPHLPDNRAALLSALLNRSPLSAVYHPAYVTPPPLTALAAKVLHGWEKRVAPSAPWRGLNNWLDALVPVLAQPHLAAGLRRRWLTVPETPASCRNLGLLLEALRQRGDQRAFILEFYEAYDHFCGEPVCDSRGKLAYRRWPAVDSIHVLLRAGGADGDDEAALRRNRLGNEAFLKFRPLLHVIDAEGRRVPRDYNLLTVEFYRALDALRPWLSAPDAPPSLRMGSVQFSESGE